MPQYSYDLRGTASDVQLGRDGGRLIWNPAAFIQVTAADGTTPVQLRVPTVPANPNDAASKAYVDSLAGGVVAYDLMLYIPLQADPNEVVLIHSFNRTVTFADDFALSRGFVQNNPTSPYVLTVARNLATIGTITISPLGVFTFATTAAAPEVFLAGDRLQVTAPAVTDPTVNNITFTLAGTK
jgi:hypothetical protein